MQGALRSMHEMHRRICQRTLLVRPELVLAHCHGRSTGGEIVHENKSPCWLLGHSDTAIRLHVGLTVWMDRGIAVAKPLVQFTMACSQRP